MLVRVRARFESEGSSYREWTVCMFFFFLTEDLKETIDSFLRMSKGTLFFRKDPLISSSVVKIVHQVVSSIATSSAMTVIVLSVREFLIHHK